MTLDPAGTTPPLHQQTADDLRRQIRSGGSAPGDRLPPMIRWFDLVRWGIAVEVMNEWFRETNQNIVIDRNDLLYPIPQSEIDIFPGLYQQNPGY